MAESVSAAIQKAKQVLLESSAPARGHVATKLGRDLCIGGLSDNHQQILLRILRHLARDVEDSVRIAVVTQIKSSPLLPRSLAMTLASDIEPVAIPILRSSTVLSDADLLAIIIESNATKNQAIADRSSVTQVVSNALIESGDRAVIARLLGNDSAEISARSYESVVDGFSEDQEMLALLGHRPVLPMAIVERLIALVADELRQQIITKHAMPETIAGNLIELGRESALIRNLKTEANVGEVDGLITRLKDQRQLTATLILRALAEGDIQFFEHAIAQLSETTSDDVRSFLYDRGTGGVKMIHRRTGLSDVSFQAIKAAVDLIIDYRGNPSETEISRFQDILIQRLVEAYDRLAPGNLEHVLSQLARLFREPTDSALFSRRVA